MGRRRARLIDREEQDGASTLPAARGPQHEAMPAGEELGRGDSGIRLRTVRELPEDDDEPTRPFVHASLAREPAANDDPEPKAHPRTDPVTELDRATAYAVARLGAVIDGVADEDPASEVVTFANLLLLDLGALTEALDLFATATCALTSPSLRMAARAFSCAAAVWRAHVVDHIDELAHMEPDSLDGWSSLPEYSAMYTLAFVMPALDAVRECELASPSEVALLRPPTCAVDEAILDLNWTMRSVAGR